MLFIHLNNSIVTLQRNNKMKISRKIIFQKPMNCNTAKTINLLLNYWIVHLCGL